MPRNRVAAGKLARSGCATSRDTCGGELSDGRNAVRVSDECESIYQSQITHNFIVNFGIIQFPHLVLV